MTVTFHPFNRWAAIAIDGEPVGYMSHADGVTRLHLKKDAPEWLRRVRDEGPFSDHGACQRAIRAGELGAKIPPAQNILQFPDRRAP